MEILKTYIKMLIKKSLKMKRQIDKDMIKGNTYLLKFLDTYQ